ncbi:holo-ACP synthase [Shewanella sp. SNU WT4]|uniref:holo-ACP synthase n=1 Tax=Shewanella sp. SNU WT4 TaxID=2590015 RepID=UPI00112C6961|nr:holo-ACP synthase [Shewanella sp. SNU WT4]QDF66317.1 holo-ACP synthase [Shewanella sp. SNU WT4]
MAIIGLGSDIVEIARLEQQVERLGEKLAQRVLTEQELEVYRDSKQPARFLAKRFAAKEAAAKALGTGIGRGVSFHHIHITNNEWGAPLLTLTGGALARLQQLGGQHCHITIADERHYAVATVVLES